MKLSLQKILAAGCLVLGAGPVQAAIDPMLYDAGKCTAFGDAPLSYVFCNDGIPTSGGTTANATGALAITVPSYYGVAEDRHTGLPVKAADAVGRPGADAAGNIALDVNVSIPLTPPPAGGYPLLFFMHGCCSGNKTSWEGASFDAGSELWHYNNAWFASRGYVVVTYTARGFRNGTNGTPPNGGSTGHAELDSRSFEINDFQHLACQIYANASQWTGKSGAGGGQTVAINPSKVIATGGSYGGGFSWMALTDPLWTCTADTGAENLAMKLAAVAPRYGWTDLLYSLVPTGRHLQNSTDPLPATDGCDSGPRKLDGTACPAGGTPTGIPKKSINSGLYASGETGVPPGAPRTTFPPKIADAIACLVSSYPSEASPACMTGANNTQPLAQTLPEFMRERSAYYQNAFFDNIASNPAYRVPVFNAATLTDPLFPPSENRRMHNRLLATVPAYPLQVHFADHQHFVQNKPTDWADMCENIAFNPANSTFTRTRDRCLAADYLAAAGHDFNATPAGLVRVGITSRLNRFLDHYVAPTGNPAQPAPPFSATVALQVCPNYATAAGVPSNESGDTFSAASFEALTAGQVFTFGGTAAQTTAPSVTDSFNAQSDPVANDNSNASGACPVRAGAAPAGVATYNSAVLTEDLTMIGAATVTLGFSITDPVNPVSQVNTLQFHARLFDVSGTTAVLVDHGPRRVTPAEAAAGTVTFQLQGNAFRFLSGHTLRLEVTQDDDPHFKRSDAGGSASLTLAQVSVPRRVPANRNGAVTVRTVASSGAPAAAGVQGGDMTLIGSGDQGHRITAVTVTAVNPLLVDELSLVVGGQTVTLTDVTESNRFEFATPVVLRPGLGLRAGLFAKLAPATTDSAGGFISAAHAAAPATAAASSWWWLAAALSLALAIAARRRRLGLLVAAASLWLASCGGGGGGNIGGVDSPPVVATAAQFSLTAVDALADDGQASSWQGLPLQLGQITVTAAP